MHKCYLLVEDSSKLPLLSQEKHILLPGVLQGPFYDLCKIKARRGIHGRITLISPLRYINTSHSLSNLLSIKFIIILMLKLQVCNKTKS